MADIYRTLVTQFDPNTEGTFVVDSIDCLPNARLPDYYIYNVVGRPRLFNIDNLPSSTNVFQRILISYMKVYKIVEC